MEKYKQITIYCDIQKNHVRFVKEIPVHWICGTLKFLQTRERGKQNQFTLRNNLIKIHQYTQKLSKLDLRAALALWSSSWIFNLQTATTARICVSHSPKDESENDQVCLILPARLAAAQFYPRFRRDNLSSIRGASGNLWKLNSLPMDWLVKWRTVIS